MGYIDPEYNPITDVLSRPPEDRLDYALELIQFYHPTSNDAEVVFWMNHLRVQPRIARLMCALCRFKSVAVSYETLSSILRGRVDERGIDSLSPNITKLRRALPKGVSIQNITGHGYVLEDPERLLPIFNGGPVAYTPKSHYREWTPSDDMLLDVLYRRGRDRAVAALALGRSAGAVADRIIKLNEERPGRFTGWH